MLSVVRRGFTSTPLLELSAAGMVPPADFASLGNVGLISGCYEAIRDVCVVGHRQDIVTQGDYSLGTGVVLCSLGLRCIYAPAILYAQIAGRKMQKLSPEFREINFGFRKCMAEKDMAGLLQLRRSLNLLRHRYNIKSTFQFLPFTQVPFIISFYYALTEMTAKAVALPGLETGGFLWFSNLAVADPYYGLSIILASSASLNIHVREETAKHAECRP